jgi:hypothetical protein
MRRLAVSLYHTIDRRVLNRHNETVRWARRSIVRPRCRTASIST